MTPERRALDWLLEAQSPEGGLPMFQQLSTAVNSTGKFVGLYPEITGYTVPTFLIYGEQDAASKAVAWLMEQQADEGYFLGQSLLTEEKLRTPSIFNTVQIARGLPMSVAKSAYDWVASTQQADGSFKNCASHLAYNLCFSEDEDMLQGFRQWLRTKIRPNGWFDHSEQFSHFLAYTYMGALQLGMIDEVEEAARYLTRLIRDNGLPGFIFSDWSGSHDWTCVTGNAQFAQIFYTLSGLTGNADYAHRAHILLRAVERTQLASGGFPGSDPVYGPYCPYEAPTWAAKFYLDAKDMEHKVWD